MTDQNREEMQCLLAGALTLAQQALEASATALETAQLQAIAMNVPVPGRLHDEHEAARRRVVDCEGAIAAFSRQTDEEAVKRQRQARADRELQIAEAAAQVQQHAAALIDVADQLLEHGAGSGLIEALDKLRRACGGAGVSILTDGGWITGEGLDLLLKTPSYDLAAGIVVTTMTERLSRGKAEARTQKLSGEIVDHIKAMPQGWPAV